MKPILKSALNRFFYQKILQSRITVENSGSPSKPHQKNLKLVKRTQTVFSLSKIVHENHN